MSWWVGHNQTFSGVWRRSGASVEFQLAWGSVSEKNFVILAIVTESKEEDQRQ